MHELGIVFHIIKSLDQIGQENHLTRVASVTLELGEVSGVVHRELTDCWNWAAAKNDLLRGAELRIAPLPAVTLCHSCGHRYPTVQFGRTCPQCGSEQTVLETGNEINIREIEAC